MRLPERETQMIAELIWEENPEKSLHIPNHFELVTSSMLRMGYTEADIQDNRSQVASELLKMRGRTRRVS